MFEPEQTILLSSNLLWSPWLFDGLGASGDLARDLVIYAALHKTDDVELHLPGFCEAMGYDRANLLRPCTPAQVEIIRKTGWDAKHIKAFSNVLGLALVLLKTRDFIFPSKTYAKGTPDEYDRIKSYKIIDHIDVPSYKVKRGVATTISFKLSKELHEESRYEYKTIYPAQYLSLRTQGGEQRTAGHPDHAARRMYLRLLAKRQWWDYLLGKGMATHESGLDSYQELVEAAGLRRRNSKGIPYDPEKKVAYQLKALLKRVGALPSIMMVPKVLLSQRTGKYEVSWTRLPMANKPAQEVAAPAEHTLSLALASPVLEKRRRGRPRKQEPPRRVPQQPAPAAAAPPAPKPVAVKPVYVAPPSQERQRLRDELTDRQKALNELRGPRMVEWYLKEHHDKPGLHAQHVEEARQLLLVAEQSLKELGSKMA